MPMHTAAEGTVIELLIPGLLGPVALSSDRPVKTPVLDLLLTRGRRSATLGIDLTAALLGRFGVAASAPYCRAADDPDWDRGGFCMHADPVHLRADRDLLRLFDVRHLEISQIEADALVAELNTHFARDGLHFAAPNPRRWYLECAWAPQLETQPLSRAIGQHVDRWLPTGPDAGRWASLMNEAQMLLFQSPVNQRREAQGRPSVNGLWISGGGIWQRPSPAGLPTRVLGQDPLARGLAMAADIACAPLPASLDARWLRMSACTLAIWDRLLDPVLDQDDAAWVAAAEALERWLVPALRALRAGNASGIVIDPCNGQRWDIGRGDLRRFWRRPRPLGGRLESPGTRSV